MTCADEDKAAMDVTLECFRGFAVCLKGFKEKGVIYGTGNWLEGERFRSGASSKDVHTWIDSLGK